MRIKELFAARDMTQGAPWKRIMEFCIPMLLGNLAQQLYNTADSIIVGHYEGDLALAAVGSATPILNLMLALFVGIATGAGIVVSQSFGARDRKGMTSSIGNCIALSAIASLVIMVAGPLLTKPLLDLLGTPITLMTMNENEYFTRHGDYIYNYEHVATDAALRRAEELAAADAAEDSDPRKFPWYPIRTRRSASERTAREIPRFSPPMTSRRGMVRSASYRSTESRISAQAAR